MYSTVGVLLWYDSSLPQLCYFSCRFVSFLLKPRNGCFCDKTYFSNGLDFFFFFCHEIVGMLFKAGVAAPACGVCSDVSLALDTASMTNSLGTLGGGGCSAFIAREPLVNVPCLTVRCVLPKRPLVLRPLGLPPVDALPLCFGFLFRKPLFFFASWRTRPSTVFCRRAGASLLKGWTTRTVSRPFRLP